MLDSMRILAWFLFSIGCACVALALGIGGWVLWVAVLVRLVPRGPSWLVVPNPLFFVIAVLAIAIGLRLLFSPPSPRS